MSDEGKVVPDTSKEEILSSLPKAVDPAALALSSPSSIAASDDKPKQGAPSNSPLSPYNLIYTVIVLFLFYKSITEAYTIRLYAIKVYGRIIHEVRFPLQHFPHTISLPIVLCPNCVNTHTVHSRCCPPHTHTFPLMRNPPI